MTFSFSLSRPFSKSSWIVRIMTRLFQMTHDSSISNDLWFISIKMTHSLFISKHFQFFLSNVNIQTHQQQQQLHCCRFVPSLSLSLPCDHKYTGWPLTWSRPQPGGFCSGQLVSCSLLPPLEQQDCLHWRSWATRPEKDWGPASRLSNLERKKLRPHPTSYYWVFPSHSCSLLL